MCSSFISYYFCRFCVEGYKAGAEQGKKEGLTDGFAAGWQQGCKLGEEVNSVTFIIYMHVDLMFRLVSIGDLLRAG